jgi:Protein of unknown function (DUF3606)
MMRRLKKLWKSESIFRIVLTARMLIVSHLLTAHVSTMPSFDTKKLRIYHARRQIQTRRSDRININEDYEVRDWAKKFGVSQDQRKAANKAVGDQASAVEKHLKGKAASHS